MMNYNSFDVSQAKKKLKKLILRIDDTNLFPYFIHDLMALADLSARPEIRFLFVLLQHFFHMKDLEEKPF